MELDDGQFLTEGVPLVQYIADLVPEANLIPSIGSIERYRVSEWLTFTSSELHRGFTPLFSADLPADVLDAARRRLFERFDYLANHLVDNMFLTDNTFTVADAYCFTILNWAQFVDLEMSRWPALESYVERVKARPKVQEAMRAEELDFQGKV